jgi:hypothetical protein
VSEESMSACDYHQCAGSNAIDQPSLDKFRASRDEVDPTCQCAFEMWDCAYGSLDCLANIVLGNLYDCCEESLDKSDMSSSSLRASCECFIKPGCEEEEDGEKCKLFAEVCCGKDDLECQCNYNTKACELQLASGGNETNVTASYCTDAEVTCCDGKNHVVGCLCDLWDPWCNSYPNADVDGSTSCYHAGSYCCTGNGYFHCSCDLITYAKSSLGFEDADGWQELECASASRVESGNSTEVSSLGGIYNQTGGDDWLDATGWMSDLDHCEWFGISCDGEGYVTKVELSNNNLVGKFPAGSIASFYKLQVLDLSNNNLSGVIAGEDVSAYVSWNETNEDWNYGEGSDTTIFFNLRELVRVDLSRNKLSGEVDILFAPALEHANFSHNNFTSIDSFKVRDCSCPCCNTVFSHLFCCAHVSNSRSLMVPSLLVM